MVVFRSVAFAVNQLQESSRRVGYIQTTVKDSNFCKALPIHDFGFGSRASRYEEGLERGAIQCQEFTHHLDTRPDRTLLRNQSCRSVSQFQRFGIGLAKTIRAYLRHCSAHFASAFKYRETVIRETPRALAISALVNPCSFCLIARSGLAFVVPFFRPL